MFHVYNLMQQFFTLQVSFSEIIYTFAPDFEKETYTMRMNTKSKRMVCALLFVLLAVTGRAQEFEYQGLWYRQLTETTAEVTIQYYHQPMPEGDVVIPEYAENEGRKLQVTGIGDNAFGYTHITSFTLDRLIDFGKYVFSNCRELAHVTLPEGMKELPDNTFNNCSKLASIQLPSSLTTISVAAFAECKSLKEIDIPAGVTALGGSAFYGCPALERVTMGDQVKVFGLYCFSQCVKLKELHIPQQLEQIGLQCFLGCASLERLNFPNTMTQIGMSAFENCTALREVTLSDNVETIPDNCFSGCSSLKVFQMPAAVNSVRFRAFNDAGIESITLPEGIQQIESAAFNCQHLGEVIMKNPKMLTEWPYRVQSDAFSKSVLYFANLHVPEGSRAYYRGQDVWKEFLNVVEDNTSGKEYCEVQVESTGYSTIKVNDEGVGSLLKPYWMEIEKGQPLKLTILLDDASSYSGGTRYVASVKVNGEEMLPVMEVEGNLYQLLLDAVSENLDIVVDIPWRSYAVTISQSSGGSIYVIPASQTRMDVRVTAADGYTIGSIKDYSSSWQTSEQHEHDGKTGVIHYEDWTRDDHTITITYKKK